VKPEPLKNKNKSFEGEDNNALAFSYSDVKSAVEWLKGELIEAGIHQRKPISVITFNKILNKAFEDVMKENV